MIKFLQYDVLYYTIDSNQLKFRSLSRRFGWNSVTRFKYLVKRGRLGYQYLKNYCVQCGTKRCQTHDERTCTLFVPQYPLKFNFSEKINVNNNYAKTFRVFQHSSVVKNRLFGGHSIINFTSFCVKSQCSYTHTLYRVMFLS